ncbi:MAG: hypothetical protein ACRDVC_08630 [Acidimicrobiales bacterium]
MTFERAGEKALEGGERDLNFARGAADAERCGARSEGRPLVATP